jgi:hypothetical protein
MFGSSRRGDKWVQKRISPLRRQGAPTSVATLYSPLQPTKLVTSFRLAITLPHRQSKGTLMFNRRTFLKTGTAALPLATALDADPGARLRVQMDAQLSATSGREPVMKEKLRFLGLDVHA